MVIAIELRKSETGDQVNQLMMAIHAASFIIYNLLIVVYYYFYFRYLVTNNNTVNTKTTTQMYIAWIICEVFNFIAQLLLIVILWKLAQPIEFEDDISFSKLDSHGVTFLADGSVRTLSEPARDMPRTISQYTDKTIEEEAEDEKEENKKAILKR